MANESYNKIQPFVIADARKAALEVYEEKGTKYDVAVTPRHFHNGLDAPLIPFSSLERFERIIHHTVIGADAATAANYAVFFIADRPCAVTAFWEVHQTAGSNGGAVTLQLEKLTETEALDSGDELLVTALSLKATANTVQYAEIVQTATSDGNTQKTASLLKGDRLALKDAGTLTSVANVCTMTFITYQ